MKTISKALIGLIAFIHLYIMWFEMFAWQTKGPAIFKTFPIELFAQSEAMAANQGLYNGFLAAGLIWSLIISNKEWSRNISIFFLSCVAVAGIFGAFTVSVSIIGVQTIPAVIAIIFVVMNCRKNCKI